MRARAPPLSLSLSSLRPHTLAVPTPLSPALPVPGRLTCRRQCSSAVLQRRSSSRPTRPPHVPACHARSTAQERFGEETLEKVNRLGEVQMTVKSDSGETVKWLLTKKVRGALRRIACPPRHTQRALRLRCRPAGARPPSSARASQPVARGAPGHRSARPAPGPVALPACGGVRVMAVWAAEPGRAAGAGHGGGGQEDHAVRGADGAWHGRQGHPLPGRRGLFQVRLTRAGHGASGSLRCAYPCLARAPQARWAPNAPQRLVPAERGGNGSGVPPGSDAGRCRRRRAARRGAWAPRSFHARFRRASFSRLRAVALPRVRASSSRRVIRQHMLWPCEGADHNFRGASHADQLVRKVVEHISSGL